MAEGMHESMTDARSFNADQRIKCDAVVVGSGAGGAAAAWSLARQGWDVVIVEEGGPFATESHPRRFWDATRTMYRDAGGTVAVGRPIIPLPMGKTWGGTTTVNSGTCLRIPDFIFEKWQKEKSSDLTAAELAPYYDQVEKFLGVAPVEANVLGEGNRLFAMGADKLGLSNRPLPRNAPGCKGSGLCAFGCPTGAKSSVDKNFLPEALQAGARGLVHLKAEEILLRRGRAAGIVAYCISHETGKKVKVHITSQAVVLAAGAVHTPLLLQQNQIANASGEVGRNLRIHPAAKIIGQFAHDVSGWSGVPQGWLVDEYQQEGITFEGAFVPPAGLAMALSESGRDLQELMQDYNKLAGFGVMVTDRGSGTVAPGPFNRPLIRYKLHREDVERFRRGIAIGARIYFAAGAQRVLSPIRGFERLESEEDIQHLEQTKLKATDLELIAFHPLGTCRSGLSPYKSVIQNSGESWDLPGLFLADASVFPGSPAVNPQLTIMSLALRTAESMEEQRGRIWQ